MNYYNEFDPYAAQWLRNLIDAGHIPAGHVDTRSIVDVQPSDLIGYTQCHFFAGVGGWSLAARLAGWPDDRELWTGSCPCQPFSVAGKGKAQDDDRHLWPHFFRLIRARRPAVVVGEQVAAAVGKDWLDGVSADLEGIDYACGSVVVPACAVNAPHRRDRLWFLARACVVGDGISARLEGHAGNDNHPAGWSQPDRSVAQAGGGSVLADAGCERREVEVLAAGAGDTENRERQTGLAGMRGAWDDASWIRGHDGKARRFEPGIRLLAHGVSGRMAVVRPGYEGRTQDPEALHWYSRKGALKAFGNAIVPQVAAEVIGAYMDCYPEIE